MQPFNQKALYSVLLTIGAYVIAYYLLNNINGWIGIICRSLLFTIVIIGGVFAMKLTPDAFQLFENLKQKLVKPKLYQ
jgi:hypothetical protein